MSNFFEEITIIAEVAQSYEGSFDLALASIDAAAQAQADLVNFQVFAADELAVPSYHYFDLYRRIELPITQWQELFEHARRQGLKVMANVFGPRTAEKLAKIGVSALKVHAADTANLPFLRHLADLGKPVLLSTGGSTLSEVSHAIKILHAQGKVDVALILGVQNSPTSPEDTNLARIRLLKERFRLPVGYADHIDGETPLAEVIAPLAFAAGADFVEKHINLARSIKREDYISALNPDEFGQMVTRVKEARRCIGLPGGDVGNGELAYREQMKKRVVARKDLEAGQSLTYEDLDLLRIDSPSDLWSLESAIGRTLLQPVQKYQVLQSKDLAEKPGDLKRVVAVLLCRATSTRLHAKPLHLIGDKTILELLISQIKMVSRIDDIILAISEGPENAAFVKVAKRLGLDYIFGDEEDGLKRMIKAAEFARADTVFRTTTENPFLYIDNLNEMIETHLQHGSDLTVCENLPDGTYAEIIELSALKRSHLEGEERHRSAWVSLYIYENPDKFKTVKLLPPKEVRRSDIRLTVDYPEDLIVMRRIYEAFGGEMPIPIASIIRFLDEHPEIRAINGNIDAGVGRIWR